MPEIDLPTFRYCSCGQHGDDKEYLVTEGCGCSCDKCAPEGNHQPLFAALYHAVDAVETFFEGEWETEEEYDNLQALLKADPRIKIVHAALNMWQYSTHDHLAEWTLRLVQQEVERTKAVTG